MICVDAGTTNTRVWLTHGDAVLAQAHAGVGVRDTARDGSPEKLHATLRALINDVRTRAREFHSSEATCVAAAGMITSRLGLADVPHIDAPAGIDGLRESVRTFSFPEITELPILLVPGVRCGPAQREIRDVVERDVMRGEETLCIGLLQMGIARAPVSILNLGSHWKLIQIDTEGRIARSITSIAGELLHTTQTQTILASAVPAERPTVIQQHWCEAGMAEQRRSGLGRALFCVRLFELDGHSTPEERLSFLIGAVVAADLDGLLRRGVFSGSVQVLIAGGGPIADVWKASLIEQSIPASRLSTADAESSLLSGLRAIVGRGEQT